MRKCRFSSIAQARMVAPLCTESEVASMLWCTRLSQHLDSKFNHSKTVPVLRVCDWLGLDRGMITSIYRSTSFGGFFFVLPEWRHAVAEDWQSHYVPLPREWPSSICCTSSLATSNSALAQGPDIRSGVAHIWRLATVNMSTRDHIVG